MTEKMKDIQVIEDMPKDIIRRENQVQPITTQDLKKRMEEETEQRKLITDFITEHMKTGVDFGTIKFTKRDGTEVESRPSLFKPGSEKFCSLFHFRPTFERDNDTWEMSGKIPGLFCYKCELISANGFVVGEGRGSANISEKQGWTANNAIKIAEKRAQIDAVLRTGGLSDFFTQDIEDMPREVITGERDNRPVQTYPQAPPYRSEEAKKPLQGQVTEPQMKKIFALLREKNLTQEQLKTKYGIEHMNELSKQQASEIIEKLIIYKK